MSRFPNVTLSESEKESERERASSETREGRYINNGEVAVCERGNHLLLIKADLFIYTLRGRPVAGGFLCVSVSVQLL